MARLQKRNFSRPTEVRPVGRGQLEIIELGDVAIGRISYQPGWRWSEDVQPIVGGEACAVRHVGVCISGQLHVEMDEGPSMDIATGDAYEIPAGHDAWVVGDEPFISIDTEGRRFFAKVAEAADRRTLETILFTDLVSSTELVARLGDATWRGRLAEYHALAERTIEKWRGRGIDTTGDGLLAIFDSPARAVRCAAELGAGAADLGLQQRAGVHTGEIERHGEDVRGVAVHLAARVMAAARAGETYVSSTTNALLVGSGVTLESRGVHELKGIEHPVELFVLVPG